MNQYNSYYLYQQYEKRGSQDWLPCYPNIFSVDGDGTMPLVMKKENDPDCGYTGDTEPIYRWYPLPITTDYICDECPAVTYRWENMNPSTDYYCEGTTKYYKQIRQYSYDSGTTWYDVVPPEYRQGSAYEQQSTDCGYVPPIEPQYRTTSGTPYCQGYNKYMDIFSQVSYDGGSTWSTTATTPTLIEQNSENCGYSPIPSDTKIRLSYSNGDIYTAACDSNTTLSSGDTRPAGYTYSAITFAEIGSCVTRIGTSAFTNCRNITSIDIPSGVTRIGDFSFWGCRSLTNIYIPDSVTTIADRAFVNCSGLTSCTIGSGVTSIEYGVFLYCSGLTRITVEATSPPSLGSYALDDTNDCPIYVPSASVSAYKSSWIRYRNRIASLEHRATSGTPYCDGVDKYVDVYSQISYDGGTTWETTATTTTLVEHNSQDCGYMTRTTSGTPYCSGETGYDKYVDILDQVSYDGGATWTTTATTPTLVEQDSEDCGWTPPEVIAKYYITDTTNPTPIGFNQYTTGFSAIEIDGVAQQSVVSAYTFSTTGEHTVKYTLTDNTKVPQNAYRKCYNLVELRLPNTVTGTSSSVCYQCTGLTTVVLPGSLNTVGAGAFSDCPSLSSVTIPDSVNQISQVAFKDCSGLTSITVNRTYPPTIQNVPSSAYFPFENTNNCPIYVPAESVETYKSAYGWSSYSSRIQAKP